MNERHNTGLGGVFDTNSLRKMGYQSFFFKTLVQMEERIIEEIKELYGKFEEMCNEMGKESNRLLILGYEDEIILLGFKKTIEEWAAKWFINVPWVIDSLLQMFMVWYENEKYKFQLVLSDPAYGKSRKILQEINPNGVADLPIYDPLVFDKKPFLEIVNDYIDRTEEAFIREGFNFSEQKRTKKHYKWFIYYHVFGLSIKDVCDEYKINRAANVREEINKIYDIMGFDKENRNKNKILP